MPSHRPSTRTRLATLAATLLVSLAAWAAPAAAQTFTISWQPTAQQFWTANDSTIHKLFHNGQCTQLAAEKRPDILRRGAEAIVAREVAANRPENLGNWNAAQWPAHARAAGIPTGHAPRAHALIVFAPGVLGAGSTGHIAYVQRVDRDGSVEISEMHAPNLWQVSHRHLSRGDAHHAGVTFIY